MFHFQPAPADILLGGDQPKLILRAHEVPGLTARLSVDPDLASHDGALGLRSALALAALNQRLIETLLHFAMGAPTSERQNWGLTPLLWRIAPRTASRHMNRLEASLREEIAREGPISFARFMQRALYDPQHGYYEGCPRRIGRGGDFYTSTSVGPIYGRLLAWRFATWLAKADESPALPSWIVEAGAHDGRLATDILAGFRRQNPEFFPSLRYALIEPSARRRGWQEETLKEFAGQVHWFESLEQVQPRLAQAPGRVVSFSNELLDAFPVHRLSWDTNSASWQESLVSLASEGLAWIRRPAEARLCAMARAWLLAGTNASDTEYEQLLRALPNGYTVDAAPSAANWWREAAEVLPPGGRLLTLDYGFGIGEQARPERSKGTLRGYARHQVSDNLLAEPGGQDLTAHVNFSWLQDIGHAAGLATEAFVSQERFLGLIALEATREAVRFGAWNAEESAHLRTLLHPAHLGHSFRVLVQRRP